MRPRYITAMRWLMCSTTREIVADEEIGEAELLLQVDQQVEHLRLHRDVERRDRLVGDDQLGIDRERPGDAEALALAAGEFVRVLAHGVARAGRRARTARATRSSRSAPRRDVEVLQRLADDRAGRQARIERGVGILEDDLDARGGAAASRRARASVMSSPPSTMRPAGRLDQLQDQSCRPSTCRSRIRRPGPASRPRAMAKLTPSTAVTAPTWRCSRPPCIGKCFIRPVDLEDRHGAHARPSTRSASQQATRWPGHRAQRRRLGAAALGRERAARREGAAGDRLASAAAPCRESRRAGARGSVSAAARDRAPSGRACRGAAAGRTASSTGASSTLRPAYITTTRCAGLGDDAEIVGDQHDRRAELLLELEHQVEDLRLDGDVERRGRLVGDQHLRIAGRAPWRSSRAGACRRRAGADSRRAGARRRRCARGRASRAPARAPRAATRP